MVCIAAADDAVVMWAAYLCSYYIWNTTTQRGAVEGVVNMHQRSSTTEWNGTDGYAADACL